MSRSSGRLTENQPYFRYGKAYELQIWCTDFSSLILVLVFNYILFLVSFLVLIFVLFAHDTPVPSNSSKSNSVFRVTSMSVVILNTESHWMSALPFRSHQAWTFICHRVIFCSDFRVSVQRKTHPDSTRNTFRHLHLKHEKITCRHQTGYSAGNGTLWRLFIVLIMETRSWAHCSVTERISRVQIWGSGSNVYVKLAYILLIMTATVFSAGHSMSKLTLIKTFLCTTMNRSRLATWQGLGMWLRLQNQLTMTVLYKTLSRKIQKGTFVY